MILIPILKKRKIEKVINKLLEIQTNIDVKEIINTPFFFYKKEINITYYNYIIELSCDIWKNKKFDEENNNITIEIANIYPGRIKAWKRHFFKWEFFPSYVNTSGVIPAYIEKLVFDFLIFLDSLDLKKIDEKIFKLKEQIGINEFGGEYEYY